MITPQDLRRIAAVLSPDEFLSEDFDVVWRRVTNWHIDVVVKQLVWDTMGGAAPLGDALDVLTEDESLQSRLWAATVCGPFDLVFWPYEVEPYWPEASWGIYLNLDDERTPPSSLRGMYFDHVKYNSCPRRFIDTNHTALVVHLERGPLIRSRLPPRAIVLRRGSIHTGCEPALAPSRYGHVTGWTPSSRVTNWRFPGGTAPESLRCEIRL